MTEDCNLLATFFSAVMRELKERLTSEEFAELLTQCDGIEKQPIGG